MVILRRHPDGSLALDGRPVLTEDFGGVGRRIPYAWRAAIRPWDYNDIPEREWSSRTGLCYLVPCDGPGFTRARVLTEDEVQIVEVAVAS